ncbi:hypothetical protein BGZ74_007025 [Mortierella antarctica]|nr:hypothetical protein BGZ74_007025 [Mortierella antarctica]
MAENTILSLCFPSPTPATQSSQVDAAAIRPFQQLTADISLSHHVEAVLDGPLVANNPAKKRSSIDTHQAPFNVTILGAYQNVMLARGSFMRNSPLKPRLSIKVNKASIALEEETTTQDEGAGKTDELIPSSTETDTTPRIIGKSSSESLSSTEIPRRPSVSGPSAFSPNFTVIPKFKESVDQISSATRTSITLLSTQLHLMPKTKSVAHSHQEIVELLVAGTWENAEAARLLLLVAIDTLQPGIVSEKMQVELRYQNMIGGRKRQELQDLMARTRTSIYMTSPFVQTANKGGSPVDPRYNDIYITGEASQVQIAKETLTRAYSRARSESISCTRQVNIATRKLEWMLLNHREKLRAIMLDNASFIAFPPLGATHPIIFVYGETRVNVERTIRMVMQLSCLFHSGSITMLAPIRENMLPMHAPNGLSPIANVSKLVSQASGAEVEYRNNSFFIFGNEVQTRMAVQFLADVDFIKALPYEVKFSVELATEHREFISGKKNGKINRIMKATGAKIKFDQCNEYNFYVDLSSVIALKAVEALALLQEELPAEISFFVPETYHKRIIGVGGKNIQRIMKKYGVYVKFSNSEEFANLGGYFDNLDNVVARTPSKNTMNLDNLKQAVMELVNPKDKDFVHQSMVIPKQHHLTLLSDHAKALSEIHEATNSTIRFPERESGSDVVWMSGPEAYIQQATSMLLSLVDEQYAYWVPFSASMGDVLATPEFQFEVVDRMKNEWNMTLVVPEITKDAQEQNDSITSSKTTSDNNNDKFSTSDILKQKSDEPNGIEKSTDDLSLTGLSLDDKDESKDDIKDVHHEDHLFVFKYTRNNENYLQNAKELLVQYLTNRQIEVYEDDIRLQRSSSDSLSDSFPHFNGRVLSSVGGELPPPSPSYLNYSLFDNGAAFDSMTPGSHIPHMMGSGSGDIRALFSNGSSTGLPLAPSPSRWSDQTRLASGSGSLSSLGSVTPTSGPYVSHTASMTPNSGSSSPYTRLSSLPSDPWASVKTPSGYQASMGQYRGTPPGMSSSSSGAYYSPGHNLSSLSQSQSAFSPDGSYNKSVGYQTPGSSSGLQYSGNSSPAQSVGQGFGLMGQHQSSPQRPISGSSGARSSLQLLEDNLMSGTAFGPGYGPALNSGSGRASNQQQQQMIYQQHQQQHQQLSQQYPSHLSIGQTLQFPQQRQRHSSQNSAASHHTMFLGPIGGGLGSAGGSVNSDEISTEDDSDEAFDEMKNRHRMHHTQSLQQQYLSQNSNLQGYEGFSSLLPSPAGLSRRGSAPSIAQNQAAFYQKQEHQLAHSSSGSDLYTQHSLGGSMNKHQDSNLGFLGNTNRAPGSGAGSNRVLSGISSNNGSTSSLGMSSIFENDRDFFSSGLGGIIGGGTISYGNNSFGTPSPNGFGSVGMSHSSGHVSGTVKPVNSALSATATPFHVDSPTNRGDRGSVNGWDR